MSESEEKKQFNVYLSERLIREVKYAALDSDQSLSGFVAEALEARLEQLRREKEGKE